MNSSNIWRQLVCGAFGLAVVSSAQASLVVYEGFDYTAGTTLGTSTNGGTGFSGAWGSSSAFTIGSSSLSNAAFPAGMATGGSVSSAAGGTVIVSSQRNLEANTALNMDASGNTIYVSTMLYKTSTTNTSSEMAQLRLKATTSDDKNRILISLSTNDTLQINDSVLQTSVVANQVYFVVLKIVTSATGNDTIYANVYTGVGSVGTAEPTTWSLTWQEEIKGSLQQLKIQAGPNTGSGFDEIRVGTTWADVTSPVPEAASLGFLGLGALSLLSRRHGVK